MSFNAAAALAALVVVSGTASAMTASAHVRQNDILNNNSTVESISNVAINGIGGFAWTLNASNSIGTIWGNANGGLGSVIRTEGNFDGFGQTGFEFRLGLADNGDVFYSATSERLIDNVTGIDTFFRNDNKVWAEEDMHTFDGANPFISFASAPGMTQNGTQFGVLGFTDSAGGSSQNRGLLIGDTVVLKGGDMVGGSADLVRTQSSNIAFDSQVSELGTNWITEVQLDGDAALNNAMVVNGNIYQTLGGGLVREGQAVSAAAGGLAGEVWDDYDFMGINEAGDVFFTGDTSNGDVIVKNGEIVLRAGDLIATDLGMGTIDATIESGDMNADGDWAAVWDVDVNGNSLEALLVNGEAVLLEGDAVDWNGDGVIDASDNGATIEEFSGIGNLQIADRVGLDTELFFSADIVFDDGSELEGGFSFTVQVPTPGATSIAVIAGLATLRRRR